MGHTQEIYDVLSVHEHSVQDWANMVHIARTTGVLYKNMYDEAVAIE